MIAPTAPVRRTARALLLGLGLVSACSSDAGDSGAADSSVDGNDVGQDDLGDDAGGDLPAGDADADPGDVAPDAAPDAASDAGDADDVAPDARPDARDEPDAWNTTDGALPPRFLPEAGEFMVAVLPDTQIYAQSFPETFESQLRWIAENAETYNIVFVSHVGDIVQTAGVQSEWDVATAAYDWIEDIDLAHGFSIGGHDTSGGYTREIDSSCSPFSHHDCDHVEFMAAFGPQHYTDRAWFGGASPSGRSTYQLVSVGELELLFLHLPQDTPAPEVEWAGEVLDAHPGALAHLTTHRYLFDYRLTSYLPLPLSLLPAGRFNTLTYELGGQSLMFLDGIQAEALFSQLVYDHPNVWAVHCGHVDAEFYQVSENRAGLPVYEILVDFQDMADGGGGWLRLLHFRPASNEVAVLTYSTVTGELRGNGDGFEHSLEILEAYGRSYGGDLERFGLTQEQVDELLESVGEPGEVREAYYESLYGAGARDSHFVLDVDFAAYVDAGRE
jgi:hypothetical protein